MTVYATPERALLTSFEKDPTAWRPVVDRFLHVGLSDLVDFCAEWYGTEPSPVGADGGVS